MSQIDSAMMEQNALVLASHGRLEMVRELVESHPELVNASGVGDDFGGERPIDAGAHTHNRAIVETLLAHGAEHNIYSAAFMGDYDRVASFIETDPGLVQTPGVHSIPILSFVSDRAVAELLLTEGAEANAASRAPFNTTPLHGAARRGYTDVVELLLLNGADTTATDYNGKTPRELATQPAIIALFDRYASEA